MATWAEADRQLDRSARWVFADVALTALFLWITVVSLRSDAYIDQNGAIEGAGWLLALSPTLMLPIRRWVPLSALLVATALYFAISISLGDSNAPLAAPFFAYAVGITRPMDVSWPIVAGCAAVLSVGTFGGPGDTDPLTAVVWFVLLGSGWLIATSIRRNQTRAERLQAGLEKLEADQVAVARQAEADERARIARELHDAVGHAVNVMVLQAGAARLTRDREQALDALSHIEHLGRNALVDLDHLLGLLRETEDEPLRGPLRSVDDITTLIDELRAAGANIELDNRCRCTLDWRTGAAAYRIAQESLTNALKHAGDARITVTMSCTTADFRLVVVDDGLGRHSGATVGGGRGIPGMVERANVVGGHLAAGPRPGRGFGVEVTLPRSPDEAGGASGARCAEADAS